VFVQPCPLSSILFNLFINDTFNKCNEYGISNGDKRGCGDLSFLLRDISHCRRYAWEKKKKKKKKKIFFFLKKKKIKYKKKKKKSYK